MATPKVLIVRAPGSNCDLETQYAFEQAGGKVDRLHIHRLRDEPTLMDRYQILVIPGGFSYGDDLAAGRVFALNLTGFLSDALHRFRDQGKMILGICNGFQVLLKAGLLVIPDEDGPLATLTFNESGRYEDRWAQVTATPGQCPFLTGVEELYLPVAHAEGKFQTRQSWILRGLEQAGQIVLRYSEDAGAGSRSNNPSGSKGNVAGLCDPTGRVLGLMPHPERHILPTQHPQWTRHGLATVGEGLRIFQNAVQYASE